MTKRSSPGQSALRILAPLCAALFGFALQPSPSAASSDACALLWVPRDKFSDWEALWTLLDRYPQAHLTVALDPEEITPPAREALAQHIKQKRLDLAVRMAGDPILPLISRYRPHDVAERMAIAKAKYQQFFGAPPLGFVPGAGAFSPALASLLTPFHLRWVAIGASTSTAATTGIFSIPIRDRRDAISASLTRLVSFHVLGSTQSLNAPLSGPCAMALDETNGPGSSEPGLSSLSHALSHPDRSRWETVEEYVTREAPIMPAKPSRVTPLFAPPRDMLTPPWPSWTGEEAAWTADGAQKRAWSLYAQAAAALTRYQNSGLARLAQLAKATEALNAAEASRYFKKGALNDPSLEREFRAHIRAVFKAIRVPAPEPMALTAVSSSEPSGVGAASSSESVLQSSVTANSVLFENPPAQSQGPSGPAQVAGALSSGTTAHDLWIAKNLTVSWDDQAVTFSVDVATLSDIAKAPFGFSPLMFDVYIDLNHIAGQGSTQLLPDRNGFLRAVDAWEYALTVTGWGAAFYRAGPAGQSPIMIQQLDPRADKIAGRIQVSIPRAILRGNPATWGYLLITLATDAPHARQDPPLPLPAYNGNPILGLLGTQEDQTSLSNPSQESYRRFSAVRLPETLPGEPR